MLRCLTALLEQNFNTQAYEIIVVSDGPDKLTESALAGWVKQNKQAIKYFLTPQKKGPAAARNYGWLNAKGNLIAFTDDDCIPDENWLQSFVKKYDGSADIVFTGQTIVPISKRPTDYELNISNLQTADFITANCCCTKQALTKAGGFDEQFTMAWREDSDLEFRFIKAGVPIEKVEQAIVIHPVRQARWGVSIKEQKKTMFNALLYKKYPSLYRQKIQPAPPVNYYIIIGAVLTIIAGLIYASTLCIEAGSITWLVSSVWFIYKRLRSTTLAPNHFIEMTLTSFLIPFLSIYWQFYGAIKYRVLFI